MPSGVVSMWRSSGKEMRDSRATAAVVEQAAVAPRMAACSSASMARSSAVVGRWLPRRLIAEPE